MLAGGVRVLVRCVCPCVCGLALALYTTAPTRWPCFRTPYIAFGRAVRVLAFGGGECVNGGPFVSRWRCSRRSAAAGEQCAMPTSARRALQHTERTEPSLLPAGFILPSYALSLPVAISPHQPAYQPADIEHIQFPAASVPAQPGRCPCPDPTSRCTSHSKYPPCLPPHSPTPLTRLSQEPSPLYFPLIPPSRHPSFSPRAQHRVRLLPNATLRSCCPLSHPSSRPLPSSRPPYHPDLFLSAPSVPRHALPVPIGHCCVPVLFGPH